MSSTSNTLNPALPAVPSDVSPQLRMFLERVKEVLEILTAVRGDPLDQALTRRQLYDSGIIEIFNGVDYDSCPSELRDENPQLQLI